ncbi:MAG: glycosyltransferase family 4 protein, partial [Terriglobales bacterium]
STYVTSLFALSAWRARNVFGSMALWRMLSARYLARILLSRWVEKHICLWCDHVVVQAPGLIDRLLEDVPVSRAQVHVLTNSVDVDFWAPAQHPANGQPNPQAELLFVGNFYAGKGLPVLFEALSILKQSGAQCSLKAVGSWVPHCQREVLRALRRYDVEDRVVFMDPVSREDLRTLYQNSHVLLYQTRDDGSPRVVLEALACGLPVVASHHPGIDHFDPQGEFIAFTEFGDAARVAEYVLDVQRNPGEWAKRSRRGRERMGARFSTAAVADEYAAFYRSILRG